MKRCLRWSLSLPKCWLRLRSIPYHTFMSDLTIEKLRPEVKNNFRV
ncbi:MAG: hypothetical protein RMY00_29735 [Nostoc sp. ChiVER01]|nr:hypothetical protein [Nostoc sp. ChiVER01]